MTGVRVKRYLKKTLKKILGNLKHGMPHYIPSLIDDFPLPLILISSPIIN